ncbi:MAG: hypothetical protein ACFFEY_12660 [Candidatus Thorarchaeota archaeon]
MYKRNRCAICIIGIIFALLEILVVIGEIFGWISYNTDIDSFLFIIFLLFTVSYQEKTKNIEVKKYE